MKSYLKKGLTAVLTLTACGLCCIVTYILVAFADDISEPVFEEYFPVVDFTQLPEQPTEEDWYDVAVTLLHDIGWSPPHNMVQFGASFRCGDSYTLEEVSNILFEKKYLSTSGPIYESARIWFGWHNEEIRILTARSINLPMDALLPVNGLDFSRKKVSAADAYDLAEANGGAEFRESIDNNCEVLVRLSSGTEWHIDYSGDKTGEDDEFSRPQLNIYINAMTGKIRIEEPSYDQPTR